ncbi:hypothetical protein STEG23_007612 [Scotinomys teguina]
MQGRGGIFLKISGSFGQHSGYEHCAGSHFVNQAIVKLTDIILSLASPVLGLKRKANQVNCLKKTQEGTMEQSGHQEGPVYDGAGNPLLPMSSGPVYEGAGNSQVPMSSGTVYYGAKNPPHHMSSGPVYDGAGNPKLPMYSGPVHFGAWNTLHPMNSGHVYGGVGNPMGPINSVPVYFGAGSPQLSKYSGPVYFGAGNPPCPMYSGHVYDGAGRPPHPVYPQTPTVLPTPVHQPSSAVESPVPLREFQGNPLPSMSSGDSVTP